MGVSSLAAYNGTGTQGTAVTNTITTSDDGDVQSVFWNANDTTRVLLFGSSINEIPTSGGSTKTAPFNGVQIFTVNNDLDALGDLYLQLEVNINEKESLSVAEPGTTQQLLTLGDPSIVGPVGVAEGTVDIWGYEGNATSGTVVAANPAGKLTQLNALVGAPPSTSAQQISTANGLKELNIAFDPPVAGFKPFGITSLVKRVEFMVGTQVWQTMEYPDILAALNTEINEGNYTEMVDQSMGMLTEAGSKYYGPRINGMAPVHVGETYRTCIKLPLLTKTINDLSSKFSRRTEDGYLMAAAPHQQVKIKVYYSGGENMFVTQDEIQRVYLPRPTLPPISNDAALAVSGSGTPLTSLLDANGALTATATELVDSGPLMDLTNNMTDASWFIAQFMATHARLNFTPSKIPTMVNFNATLLGKHQIMCNAERQQLKNMPQGLPKRIKMTQNAHHTASSGFTADKTVTVDLDHFSLYASYLVIKINYSKNIDKVDYDTGGINVAQDYLAINRLVIPGIKSAELLLNSTSVSGVLPGSFLSNTAANSLGIFSNSPSVGTTTSKDYYIFPLASHAYDGSAIPLNRFDNIRLKIVPDSTISGVGTIDVTCFGETTALYDKSSASLAMY
jgi:hypothetical protein